MLYNTKTRQQETLPADKVQEAIASGTHSYGAKDRVDVLDADGKSWNVPSTDVQAMLKDGYSIETPDQAAVREYVKDNAGLKGTAKVALGQFVDEGLMGIPETIYDGISDPLDVAKKEALKKDHELANTIGGITGFGASMLYGGPVGKISSAASKAGAQVAEKLVAKKLVDAGVTSGFKAIAKDISKNIARKSIEYGVEGAAFSAPLAITEGALGDLELAGETLMMGGLLGAGLGAGSSGLKELAKQTGHAAGKLPGLVGEQLLKAKGVGESGSKLAARGLPKTNIALSAEERNQLQKAIISEDRETVKSLLTKHSEERRAFNRDVDFDGASSVLPDIDSSVDKLMTIGKKSNVSQDAISGLVGYALGDFVGGGGLVGAGAVLGAKKLIEATPRSVVKGILFAENAMKTVADSLEAIPSKIEKMKTAGKIKDISSTGAMSRFLGEAAASDKVSQLEQINAQLAKFNNNPSYAAQMTGRITDSLANSGAPGVADAYAVKNALVAKYLSDNIPKPTKLSSPFKKEVWKPSDQELAIFERKLQAINNPLSIIDDLGNNTLRRESVEAVKAVYPKLFTQIQNKLTDHFMEHPTDLPYAARLKLSMLLELPLGDELVPTSIQYLQNNFNQPTSPTPSGKAPIVPDMATETQKLSGS